MTYQVLARRWRPQTFEQMVGQEHVLRALVNALDRNRLHHAYLLTGTRGVGKTTLARLIAKSLNCEQGVSSSPCGTCSACREIAEGRFVDLLEVDAASRTKVEDTRELLDNVQYAPARGRYKVYLIDEVHMLSGHSFNALLKTLEEPPPHVKFLLATTDPQRLPATVLSMLSAMGEDHVFYRVVLRGQTVTGYEGLALPDTIPTGNEPLFYETMVNGTPVRAASLTRAILFDGAQTEGQVALAQTRHGQAALATRMEEEGAARLGALDDSPSWRGEILYNLACQFALNGEHEKALVLLTESLSLQPGLREWSTQDADLVSLREDPAFLALVG